ncbi:MAG: BMC domain-containing protein [Lachnospiraceae bacterium]|nr:BMC domain-containing protein [Lachnospiraceae bacterium]
MDFSKLMQEGSSSEGLLRIIQETVPGREITLAHIIASPKPIVYRKLGLNPNIDFEKAAIGIIKMTPAEAAVIASDIAVKTGDIYLGFVDRFSGTLIITGRISSVESALQEVVRYCNRELGYNTCKITKR